MEQLQNKIKENLIVYDFPVIRKELRNIPKRHKKGKQLRIALLNLYDNITNNHNLEYSPRIEELANEYYQAYRQEGGIKSKNDILNDFLIIACAVLNNLDIVFSNDEKTMISRRAMDAFKKVNQKYDLETPYLFNYAELIRRLTSPEFD